MLSYYGIQIHHTTAYYPQANGLVERFHHHLKASLRARLTGPNWTADLPWVLLGFWTAPKDDLGCSSAELVYSTPLAVPGNFSQITPPELTLTLNYNNFGIVYAHTFQSPPPNM